MTPSNDAVRVIDITGDRGMVTAIGAGQYRDGSRVVQVVLPGQGPDPDGWGLAYRTYGQSSEWKMLMKLPASLAAFLRSEPVGTRRRVANRDVEVIDIATAVPDGVIACSFPFAANSY